MAEKNTNGESGGLFGGLKRLLFKEDLSEPAQPVAPATSSQPTPQPVQPPATITEQETFTGTPDEQMRAKAYQLLESINQPGCDFMEVWNAAEENGGATGANIKSAFNALKYADKSLTKEKVLTSGAYYADELQKALDADIARKTAQRQQLDTEKQQQRQQLSDTVQSIEQQIADLQQSLTDKKNLLAELDNSYAPKITELEQKMSTGKATISAIIQKMRTMLSIVEKEL